MSDRIWQVGICGTFDVENYGDLLFPLIAEAELRRRLDQVELHRFSYRRKTPADWPYAVTSVTDLPDVAGQLDGMIVGGGIMVRFDKVIAADYAPSVPSIHHPTGYWLSPMLIALQHGCPVMWNAPGALGEVPIWAEPLLDLVIRQGSYLAVRDAASQQTLGRFARSDEIRVVPDTAFGLGHLVDLERPSVEFARLRQTLGLRTPYIVVQAAAGLEAFSRLVCSHPHIFRDYQIVILPTGPVNGDDVALVADDLPQGIPVTTWPHPLVIAELIGHASAAVGISLHLAITAIVFGVPVFRPAHIFGQKYAMLLAYDTVFSFASELEIDPQWFAARLGRTQLAPAMTETLSRLTAHWDTLAAVVAAGRSTGTLETLGRSWQSVPGWLETWALRHAAALAAGDSMRADRDAWTSRCAAALAEGAALRAERDNSAVRYATALAERDALQAERDAIQVDRDALRAEGDAIRVERDALRAERDTLRVERDALRASTSWRVTTPLRTLGDMLGFGLNGRTHHD